MPLEEIEKKLYSRENESEEEEQPTLPKRPKEIPRPGAAWGRVERQPEVEMAIPRSYTGLNIKKILSFGFVFIAIAGIGIFLYLTFIGTPEIGLTFSGPREVKVGTRVEFEVIIENHSRVNLENTSITFRPGAGVILAETNERVLRRDFEEAFAPGAIRKEKIAFYALGQSGDSRNLEVSFRYKPSNIASEFVKTENINVALSGSAVALELGLPKQALSGNNFSFGINWRNLADISLADTYVDLQYPAEFAIAESNPQPAEGHIWKMGDLAPYSTSSIALVGGLNAAAGQVRKFHIDFSAKVREDRIRLGSAEAEISVIENPLAMAMSLNGAPSYNANPGETLEYKITFKNNFQETLRNIVIVAKLKGRMFDLASVKSSGAYDSRNLSITFNGGNTPQLLFLGPQESGEVSFRITLLKDFPAGLSENVIRVDAEMSSATKPKYLGLEGSVGANTFMEAKVNGVLTLSTKVLVHDAANGFSGLGPWPMRQNQTTQFYVHIAASAAGNAFDNIIVTTILPDNVKYAGNISGTEVLTNPRTNQLTWRIPKLDAYQSRELVFRIDVTPLAADVGLALNLLNEANLDAVDSFTKNKVHISSQVVRSDNLTDPTVNALIEGRVQQ